MNYVTFNSPVEHFKAEKGSVAKKSYSTDFPTSNFYLRRELKASILLGKYLNILFAMRKTFHLLLVETVFLS